MFSSGLYRCCSYRILLQLQQCISQPICYCGILPLFEHRSFIWHQCYCVTWFFKSYSNHICLQSYVTSDIILLLICFLQILWCVLFMNWSVYFIKCAHKEWFELLILYACFCVTHVVVLLSFGVEYGCVEIRFHFQSFLKCITKCRIIVLYSNTIWRNS